MVAMRSAVSSTTRSSIGRCATARTSAFAAACACGPASSSVAEELVDPLVQLVRRRRQVVHQAEAERLGGVEALGRSAM